MKFNLSSLKSYIKLEVIEKWKLILFPDFNLEENQGFPFRKTIQSFIFAISCYIIFYFVVFLVGFSYYSEINKRMEEDFILKGNSYLSYFFNSYPFNIIYVISLLIIFIFFISSISYLLYKGIEEVKIKFESILSATILMTCWWVFILFFFLLINTSYPFNQTMSIVYLGILIALWIILLVVGLFFSSKNFANNLIVNLNTNKKRTYLIIYVTQILFFYFIFSIIT